MASPGCVGELEEVVGGADHGPLASRLFEAAQAEPSEAPGLLDLPEHGLDDLPSEAVSAVPAGALEPGRHGGDARALGGASLADRVSLLMRASSRREMGAGASPGEMARLASVQKPSSPETSFGLRRRVADSTDGRQVARPPEERERQGHLG